MVGDHPRRTQPLERDGLLVTSITWFREQTDIGGWVEAAACRGAGPRLWFPDDNGISVESKAAKAICAECPVQVDCREYGIEHEPKHGIWGGLAAKERVAIRRKRRARDAHNAATRDLFDRIAGEVEAC